MCARPSLHLGFVRTLGSDVGRWIRETSSRFESHSFHPAVVKLSALLNETAVGVSYHEAAVTPTFWSYASRMVAGDIIRSRSNDSQVLITAALYDVLFRDGATTLRSPDGKPLTTTDYLDEADELGAKGLVFLYDSLLHPAEVSFMRHMFGSYFLPISVGAPLSERHLRLRAWLLKDYEEDSKVRARLSRESLEAWWLTGSNPDAIDKLVDDLLLREARGSRFEFETSRNLKIDPDGMLDINKAFDQGEVFLRSPAPDRESLRNPRTQRFQEESELDARDEDTLDRFIAQVFGYPFGTPNFDEFGIGLAYVASRLSADLSRRVGAAVIDSSGDLLSLGKNEVPMGGGRTYAEWTDEDGRDFRSPRGTIATRGFDPNEAEKLRLAALIVDAINPEDDSLTVEAVMKAGLSGLTEYGRTVHAEMDAILTAARLGRSAHGGTIFTTTYPCHNCMRHIIHAGISRVVYVEAYPKSKATILHSDSIHDEWTTPYADQRSPRERTQDGGLDTFAGPRIEPFFGISSRRHADLFSWVPRKVKNARVSDDDDSEYKGTARAVEWEKTSSTLRPSFGRLHAQVVATSQGSDAHAYHSMWSDIEKVVPNYVQVVDIEHLFDENGKTDV